MFKSEKAFWEFKYEILHNFRYCHSDKVISFLDEFKIKIKNYIAEIKEGTHFVRAQKGFVYRDDYQDNILMGQLPTAFPKERMKPLSNKSKEGRLNPKGIPYLYLATEINTAIAETRPWIGEYVSVGHFKITRNLKLIYFEKKRRKHIVYFGNVPKEVYDEIVWENINEVFSRPISNNDDTAEYVPTQILSKFIKKEGYDGIIYGSTVGSGLNILLFSLEDDIVHSLCLYEVKNINIKTDRSENTIFINN